VRGTAGALESPLGFQPRYRDMNWQELDYPFEKFQELSAVSRETLFTEAAELKEYFQKFSDRLPESIEAERRQLEERSHTAPDVWRVEE